MAISNNIGKSYAMMTGLISHQSCFLEPLFRLSTQGRRITMLKFIQLVIAGLHNIQRDINHVNQQGATWQIKEQEDVWEAWRQYLDLCEHHDYCLEKYHIIKCGYSIKCNPEIPEELYQHVDTTGHSILSPFKRSLGYTKHVLGAMMKNDAESLEEAVRDYKNYDQSRSLLFCKDFFKLCEWLYKKPNLYDRLKMNETSFNYSFIWPIMEFSVDSLNDSKLRFVLGEYILESSAQEYKADVCLVDSETEVCILETSGKFKHNESGKYGFDHIKINFGALCLFNAIYKKYYWATEKTALELQTPFLYAVHDEIHLWVIQLCSPKLYSSNKIYKATVPQGLTSVKDIITVGNLCWTLKASLETAVRVLRKMRDEHEGYLLNKLLDNDLETRTPLSRIANLEIQKPVHGFGYGVLLSEEKSVGDIDIIFK